MQETKKLIQIATRVQETLTCLNRSQYSELLSRLKGLASQLQELNGESRKLATVLARGWFAAAEHCRMRAGRLINDISCSISRAKQFAEGCI